MINVVERLFETGARTCAILVVAIAPMAIAALVVASVLAVVHGTTLVDAARFFQLGAATLGLALAGASLGLIIGGGAGLYTMEIATPGVRQGVRALAGALHAVPAVGFGIVAAGGLLFAAHMPSVIVVFGVAATTLAINIGSIAFVQMRRELASVPAGLREAAAASGADPATIALDVVLPSLRKRIAGLWWSLLATAMGEGVALQIIFASALVARHVVSLHPSSVYGTYATWLLEQGATQRDTALFALAPVALALLGLTVAAVLIGRRAAGQVPWP